MDREPERDEVTAAHVSRFARWASQNRLARLSGDYLELWRWSVDRLGEFWPAVWDYFGVRSAIAAPAIPHTRTGKKLEIPVKRILQGGDPRQVVDAGAVDDPDALPWFAAYQTRTPNR
jgi:hypothetical protein